MRSRLGSRPDRLRRRGPHLHVAVARHSDRSPTRVRVAGGCRSPRTAGTAMTTALDPSRSPNDVDLIPTDLLVASDEVDSLLPCLCDEQLENHATSAAIGPLTSRSARRRALGSGPIQRQKATIYGVW